MEESAVGVKFSLIDKILFSIGCFFISGVCHCLSQNDTNMAITFGIIVIISLFFPIKKLIKNPEEFNKNKIFIIVVSIFFAILSGMMLTYNNDYTSDNTDDQKEEVQKNKVTMIDFTAMDRELANSQCSLMKIKCSIVEEYSDNAPKGEIFKQSIEVQKEIYEGDTIKLYISLGKEPTIGQRNALSKAKSYLNAMAFSYTGLIKQLEFEKYSHEDAVYGADNCGANWNEQAAIKAKNYLDTMAFSRDGLIKQLEFEGFTHEQAIYGVTQNGY